MTEKPAAPRKPRFKPFGGKPRFVAEREAADAARGRGKGRPLETQTGLAPRQEAVRLVASVLHHRHALDDALAAGLVSGEAKGLAPRDRAMARAIASAALRHRGSLDAVIASFLDRPLPERTGRLPAILLAATAQLLTLAMPAHAVINLAVEQVRADPQARRFDKLANAVLRRVSTIGPERLAELDTVAHDIPGWLWSRWVAAYGEPLARRIADATLSEAPLDLSVRADPQAWADRLKGRVVAGGSVRLAPGGRIDELDGFADGAWWVQDAAAALPARLLGDVRGLAIADLCAAPGGKTLQLAAAGAHVTAVDLLASRLARVRENLARTQLTADLVAADSLSWKPGRTFDAVLIDAPCTATGTIRRHPDILHLKRPDDILALAAQQERLLSAAARLVSPGGRLVYCTCSLEPEEGVDQVERFLAAEPGFARAPIVAGEASVDAAWITSHGDLRTLPCHLPLEPAELSGLDGFYAARLVRLA